MKAIVAEALRMIADPAFADKDWPEVVERQALDPNEDADGECFCSAMYSSWIYANKGDDAALRAFIERADPQRLVRDDRDPEVAGQYAHPDPWPEYDLGGEG